MAASIFIPYRLPSGNILFYRFGRIIQHIRVAQEAQEILDNTGIIEAVADAFIQIESQILLLSYCWDAR